MSWINQNAVKKVYNAFKRFKEQKVTVYNNEIDALQTINTALENDSKQYVNDNLLYAKLLAMSLTQELRYRKDIKYAIKAVSSELLKPLDFHLEFLRLHLNEIDMDSHLRSLGLLDFDFWDCSKETSDTKDRIIKGISPEMFEKINHNWTMENIKKSFHNTANDFLKDVDNYK